MSVEAKEVSEKPSLKDKISEEVSDFSDVSSGLSLSSQDTNGEDYDGDTVGSVTTDSKPSESFQKPQECKNEATIKPTKTNTLNIKTLAPVSDGKESHESELARMVKRLTGNSFQNTASGHPSREKSWVPIPKSSCESATSSPTEDLSSDLKSDKDESPEEENKVEIEKLEVKQSEKVQLGLEESKVEGQNELPVEAKKDLLSDTSRSGKAGRTYKRRVGSLSLGARPKPKQVQLPKTETPLAIEITELESGLTPPVVRLPPKVVRTTSNVSTDSDSELLPPQKKYKDVIKNRLANRAKINEANKVEAKLENIVEDPLSDGNQNTSDDAESMPVSYQAEESLRIPKVIEEEPEIGEDVPKIDLSPQLDSRKIEEKTEAEEVSVSEVSEVHQEELINNINNHKKVPTKSRKPLAKKGTPGVNIQQIPEEKSELSLAESSISEGPEKKPRKKKKEKTKDKQLKEEDKNVAEPKTIENDEKLKKEYEEFVEKQKEVEKQLKEEKRKSKKANKKQAVESVKVTNIFDIHDKSWSDSVKKLPPDDLAKHERRNSYTVKLVQKSAMDKNGNMVKMIHLAKQDRKTELANIKERAMTERRMSSDTLDDLKSMHSSMTTSSKKSSSSQSQNDSMLDIILPRPVFRWVDPTLVPRFTHRIEFQDVDHESLASNTPESVIHDIVHRQKFTDGKMRSQNFKNLISIIRGNGLARNNFLFQKILEQRGSVPIILKSLEGAGFDNFSKALDLFEVFVGDGSKVNLANDVTLPRIAFISDKDKKERNPKLIELALHHTVTSGTSNVTKVRVFKETFVEIGIGFVDVEGKRQPDAWIVVNVSGKADKLMEFVENFADVIVSDGDSYTMHSKNGTIPLQNESEELDEIADELNEHLSKWKWFDERVPLQKLSAENVEHFYASSGVEALDAAVKSCLASKNVLRNELGLQELFQNYCNLLDEKNLSLSEETEELKRARETYQQQIKTSRICGIIDVFLRVLQNDDDELRILGFKTFSHVFHRLVSQYTAEAYQQYLTAANNMQKKGGEEARKDFFQAKLEYTNQSVSLTQIWREMSHVYVGNPRRSKIKFLPSIAAQHLLDGFPLELQDGDTGHLNEKWLDAVFHSIIEKIGDVRVFVQSVIGVQSAGKSTLLNTMFGTQFNCGDGMCSRGINMQLVPSKFSPLFDYILVLDTEGIRAPEFAGRAFSENKDNKMATMSIIPSDSTIMMTVGDDDSAVRDILPIVLRAYQSSSIAEESGLTVRPKMTVLYKVNNANGHSFNATLNERLSLVESLRSANEILNDCGVIGDSMDDAVYNSVMSVAGAKEKGKNDLRDVSISFINISTGDNELEGNIKFIGQLKSSPNPPDDKPEPGFGKRVRELRKYIHTQTIDSRYQPKRLSEWWGLMKDVSNSMSTMDFNFNFKNAVQLRAYNQLKNAEKKLKRDLERKMSSATERLEKLTTTKATELAKCEISKIDETIAELVEDHQHDCGVIIEEFIQNHENLLKEKHFVSLGGNKPTFTNHWTSQASRINDTKGYLFKRFASNTLKFNTILARYEHQFRNKLRKAWESSPSMKEKPEEYQKFFDNEYKNFYEELKADQPPQIDVQAQVYERFRDFEVQLESDKEKREKLEISDKTMKMILGDKDGDKAFLETWKKALKEKSSTVKKCKTNEDGEEVWSTESVTGSDETSTLVYYAKSIKLSIDDILQSCEKFSTSVVDKILYKVHQLVNKVTRKHREALLLYIFSKKYTSWSLEKVHAKWEKENNIVERFGSAESKEKMWLNFEASCKDLTEFQMVMEQLKNEMKTALKKGFTEFCAEEVASKTANSNELEAETMWKTMEIDLMKTSQLANITFNDETKLILATEIAKTLCLSRDKEFVQKIASSVKDLRGEVSKILLKNVSFPAAHYWRIFERLVEANFSINETKNSLEIKLDKHFDTITEESEKKDSLLEKLKFISRAVANPEDVCLRPICKNLLSSWFSDKMEVAETNISFTDELNLIKRECRRVISTLLAPNSLELSSEVRKCLIKRDTEASMARCASACPVCHTICLKEAGHLDKHDGKHQPLGLAGISSYKSNRLSFCSCAEAVSRRAWICKDNKKKMSMSWSPFNAKSMFKGWQMPLKDTVTKENDKVPTRAMILLEFNREFSSYYGKKTSAEDDLNKTANSIKKIHGHLDVGRFIKKLSNV